MKKEILLIILVRKLYRYLSDFLEAIIPYLLSFHGFQLYYYILKKLTIKQLFKLKKKENKELHNRLIANIIKTLRKHMRFHNLENNLLKLAKIHLFSFLK